MKAVHKQSSRFQRPDSTHGLPEVYAKGASATCALNLPDSMKLLTYGEAAQVLRVCQKTVENLCRVRREIPVVRVGHNPRIRISDLQAYINRGGSESEESVQVSDSVTDGCPNSSPAGPHEATTDGIKEMSAEPWRASSAAPTVAKASNS
jgi:excisionase family DNA binding protein